MSSDHTLAVYLWVRLPEPATFYSLIVAALRRGKVSFAYATRLLGIWT